MCNCTHMACARAQAKAVLPPLQLLTEPEDHTGLFLHQHVLVTLHVNPFRRIMCRLLLHSAVYTSTNGFMWLMHALIVAVHEVAQNRIPDSKQPSAWYRDI